MSEKKLISTSEAAKILNVSSKTIIRYIRDGKIIGYKFERHYKVDKASLDEFLNDRVLQYEES